jgi:hypothetical protein
MGHGTNAIKASMLVLLGALVCLAVNWRAAAATPNSLGQGTAGPCESGPSYKQFDFWLGEWEARKTGDDSGAPVGKSKIEKISGGCVIQENWESPGFTGKSWNFYDVGLGKWRQIWIDVTGRKAEFSGAYHESSMRFEGETVRADGVRLKSRMTFFNLGPEKVRQLAERSTDGGQTWTISVDYLYTRKK